MVRCTLLKGSAWCNEKKCMERCKGTFDIFFGAEHGMWKEDTRLEICSRCARITNEKAGKDRRHTSGGVFVAVDTNLGAVLGKEEGAVTSIPGNERRIAQALLNARGGMPSFSVYFCHSEGWTPRHEALMEAVVKEMQTCVLKTSRRVFG